MVRVVSWNLANRVGAAATQGEFLRSVEADLVLFQEANATSIETVCDAAGLEWCRLSADVYAAEPGEGRGRRLAVAIAGRGREPARVGVVEDAPLPERTLHATVNLEGRDVIVATYHAPPGVSWGIKKVEQAHAFTRWLNTNDGPVVFGADANTPQIDHPDHDKSRTHWHTGARKLGGGRGDDLLWGPNPEHRLRDALRVWLAQHPVEAASIAEQLPQGPLAVSHRTGKRSDSAGIPRRFDSIWLSDHFAVTAIVYPYDASIAAGSDHSAVIADLALQ